jgi:hypothetical protein
MKINKGLILATIVGLVYATSSNVFTNANALLTAPTDYTYAYRPTGNPSGSPYYLLEEKDGDFVYDIGYTRTADGAYYNYSITYDNNDFDLLPDGLEITHTFNRSNSGWVSSGTGLYYPDGGAIGSDGTVGTIVNKWNFIFDNQTNKDYLLSLDNSSTGGTFIVDYTVNTYTQTAFFAGSGGFNRVFINAFSSITVRTSGTASSRYLDAWYLEDLGISDSWQEGYDNGEQVGEDYGYDQGYSNGLDDGINQSGLFEIISATFSGLSDFLSVAIFGDITFGTLVLFPLMFGILFFILRVIRGQ